MGSKVIMKGLAATMIAKIESVYGSRSDLTSAQKIEKGLSILHNNIRREKAKSKATALEQRFKDENDLAQKYIARQKAEQQKQQAEIAKKEDFARKELLSKLAKAKLAEEAAKQLVVQETRVAENVQSKIEAHQLWLDKIVLNIIRERDNSVDDEAQFSSLSEALVILVPLTRSGNFVLLSAHTRQPVEHEESWHITLGKLRDLDNPIINELISPSSQSSSSFSSASPFEAGSVAMHTKLSAYEQDEPIAKQLVVQETRVAENVQSKIEAHQLWLDKIVLNIIRERDNSVDDEAQFSSLSEALVILVPLTRSGNFVLLSAHTRQPVEHEESWHITLGKLRDLDNPIINELISPSSQSSSSFSSASAFEAGSVAISISPIAPALPVVDKVSGDSLTLSSANYDEVWPVGDGYFDGWS